MLLLLLLHMSHTGLLSCPVVLRNNANMRVMDISVMGDANNCTVAVMAPDEERVCYMWRTLTEQDFISPVFSMAATAVLGTARGVQPLSLPPLPKTVQVVNPNISTALLSVAVTANTTSISRAGETVLYRITLVRRVCVVVETAALGYELLDRVALNKRQAGVMFLRLWQTQRVTSVGGVTNSSSVFLHCTAALADKHRQAECHHNQAYCSSAGSAQQPTAVLWLQRRGCNPSAGTPEGHRVHRQLLIQSDSV